MKLAHTRLDMRNKRPNIELVYDPAQKRLIEEVREIECEIQRLQERYVKRDNHTQYHYVDFLDLMNIYKTRKLKEGAKAEMSIEEFKRDLDKDIILLFIIIINPCCVSFSFIF